MKPVAIDLFAGAGFMGLGFAQAGFDVRVAVEYDESHAAAHALNFSDTKMLCRSVVGLRRAELYAAAGMSRYEEVDVIFGGAPCQGWSFMGHNDPSDPRRSLTFEFARVVGEVRPRHFVFENVKGLTTGRNRKLLDALIDEFKLAGYDCAPWRVLNAKDYGVAQSRERLFLLGSRRDCPMIKYPQPHSKKVTCADVLADLLDPEFAATLSGNKRCKHSSEVIARFAATAPGSIEPISRFPRLSADGVAPTLLAGTTNAAAKVAGKGGRYSPKGVIHYAEARKCTPRELSRLQGIDYSIKLEDSICGSSQRIGNSVPPPLARAVAVEVIKALEYSEAIAQ